ncbi:MAG: ATP-binding cassette domain-containing protein [Marinifilaceae bacterium]|jgi:ABC-type multidrug transport system ATPase subunit|nr:ATP-binding cassette domain-containing protein [Marinifilaceae bacterium]
MGESILNALMQLFAIVGNAKGEMLSDQGIEIVKLFLKRYVSSSLRSEYLSLFQNYSEFYKREIEYQSQINKDEISSLTYNEAAKVCRKINSELIQEERLLILLRLLEFVYEDKIVNEEEFEFMNVVAENFYINRQEFVNCMAFAWDDIIEDYDKSKFLIADNNITEWSDNVAWMMKADPDSSDDRIKHLHIDDLYGRIVAFYCPSADLICFKYEGELNLYLEGNKIIPYRTYKFKQGMIIKGPNIRSIYYSEIAEKFLMSDENEKIIFSAKDAEFKFKNSNNGLKRFNISEESGQLIGIMGGSGVGKSTLLNILNGNLQLNSGEISINGVDISSDSEELKGLIGFVPQDDLLIEELTVFQNLYYNAKLCFKDYSNYQLNKTIIRLLQDFSLYEAKDLIVGNPINKFISGGQRKRLNIALELMREPPILLVDEPTSGLSSTDSEKIIRLLKQQSLKGKLVIANIHQPSSDIFKMFDKLWVMDTAGHPIYTGHPIDAIVYFKTQISQVNASETECSKCGNVNPEQILQIVESKKIDKSGKPTRHRRIEADQWYETYTENIKIEHKELPQECSLPKTDFKIPKKFKQFLIFFARNILAKTTNLQYILLNLFEAPVLAVILAYFTKYEILGEYSFGENKNYPVFLFMSVVVAIFLGLTVSAEEIIRDKRILMREKFLNLSKSSYLFSKIIFLFTLSAVQMASFVLISNYILEVEDMGLNYWLVLFTVSCFSNMLGLNISASLNSVVTIYILIPLILVPQLLLGGVMIRFDDLHDSITNKKYVPVIGDFMTTRWAYEALATKQFIANKYENLFFEFESEISNSNYKLSYLIPQAREVFANCNKLSIAKTSNKSSIDEFEKLHNIIKILSDDYITEEFKFFENIGINKYDDFAKYQINKFLLESRDSYKSILGIYTTKKDSIYESLLEKNGKDVVFQFQQKYHNKALASMILNRDLINKYIWDKNEIIQKKDPIYMYPTNKNGRSHFYSPYKRIGNFFIESFWFNIIVVWLGSFFLYISLAFDLFKKFLLSFEMFRSKILKFF